MFIATALTIGRLVVLQVKTIKLFRMAQQRQETVFVRLRAGVSRKLGGALTGGAFGLRDPVARFPQFPPPIRCWIVWR